MDYDHAGQSAAGGIVCARGGVGTPFPSFPLKGEGEWRVRLEQEIINSDNDLHLLPDLEPPPVGGGRRGLLSALKPSMLDMAFKGEP